MPTESSPDTCVITKCAGELAACLIDSVCRFWNICNMACGLQDLPCQIRCADLYKPTDDTSIRINEFSECVISKNQCVPQITKTCKVPDNARAYSDRFDM